MADRDNLILTTKRKDELKKHLREWYIKYRLSGIAGNSQAYHDIVYILDMAKPIAEQHMYGYTLINLPGIFQEKDEAKMIAIIKAIGSHMISQLCKRVLDRYHKTHAEKGNGNKEN